jgi:hypothetical protein
MGVNPGEQLHPEVRVKCPFCSGEYHAGMKPDCFVIHSMPTCAEFSRMEALEFLQAARKRLQGDA